MTVPSFVHLHAHSEYSMLLGMARIQELVAKAKAYGQTALALTDHGNMFGMLEFYNAAKKAGIKPIVGCDFFVAPDRRQNQVYALKDPIHHKLILLAKTQEGYKNLLQICSDGYLDGYHQKPRIDHTSLMNRSEGLICLTSNYQGELGYALLKGDEAKAKALLDFYAQQFGKENVFLCIENHGVPEERDINQKFLELHKREGWALLATQDIHYLEPKDSEAHEILLCIESGWKMRDPEHPRFPTDQFHFRNSEEMVAIFGDFPEAIENSVRIAEACNVTIEFGVLHHPKCPIPEGFADEDAYLAYLSYEGLRERYAQVTPELLQRTEFELDVMKRMKVAGYMLIVQDFINAAKKMNIPVGPGRGSAVGSLVSYAIGITDVDPVRYKLLFERFLNPERVSMPDIDTDFSDLDRGRVIQYVVEKYGKESVAQIVTYGRMKAKMVLRDVGRVLGFEPARMNQVCKLFPMGNPFATLDEALVESPDLRKEIDSENGLQTLLGIALKLEGLVRQAGMHAAAVIIAPSAIVNYAPLFKQPGADQIMIQYDKTYSEDIGLLKMDFLGLRNLSVLQEALEEISAKENVQIDLLRLPEKDAATFQLLGKGRTVGVFQFESGGMQDYLRKLKPSALEDMIAMNALYRPGPMEFIPQYIARKHGLEPVDCYHKDLEPILLETYGVIVYQEQVMQIAQVLSGFSLGGADLLRRAMSKKDIKKMDQMRPKFVDGAKDRGYNPKLAEKIWDVLVPFSSYAFNKSHSAAYATIAYQTAYLKAHYPAYFMAANMNSEMHDTSRLVVLFNECRAMNIGVLFPNINVSQAKFSVKDSKILYGLGGIKNVGLGAVDKIVEERNKAGNFHSIFDLCKRVDTHFLNRRALESLIFAGALDELTGTRAQQFAAVEMALGYAQSFQEDKARGQISLFEFTAAAVPQAMPEPALPDVEPWPYTEMLDKEKEVLGLYLSGHPLEPYRKELEAFSTIPLDPNALTTIGNGAEVVLGGMITKLKTRLSPKDNRTFAFADLEDFSGKVEVTFWSDVFEEMRHLIEIDSMVFIRGKFQKADEGRGEKIVASRVLPLANAAEKLTRSVHIRLKTVGLENCLVKDLHAFCLENAGNAQLVLHLENITQKEFLFLSDAVRVKPERYFINKLIENYGEENVWLSAKSY